MPGPSINATCGIRVRTFEPGTRRNITATLAHCKAIQHSLSYPGAANLDLVSPDKKPSQFVIGRQALPNRVTSELLVIRPEFLEQLPRTGLLATPSVPQLCARQPHRVTEPFAFTFLIRLNRRLAPASRALTRNPQQLDPVNSRGRNCFGGECRQRRAHRRFRLSPRKNSHRNECLDVSRT